MVISLGYNCFGFTFQNRYYNAERKRNFVFTYKLSKYLADSFLLTTELSFGKKNLFILAAVGESIK